MKKKHLIVFDIDDTLTHTAKLHQTAFKEALHEMGVKEMDTNFGAYKHHTDSYIAKVIYEKDLSRPFTASKIQEFEQLLTKKVEKYDIQEIPGAQKCIQKLQNSEFAVCYATGSLLQPALDKLNRIGVSFSEEVLVASNQFEERETIVGKAIEKALTYYQVDRFERIVSVGDGLWDLKTAKNLKLEFVGIGKTNKAVLLENGMQTYFDHLQDFAV